MLIFLASTAAKTIDRIVPLLPKPAAEMRVAFVPTAGDIYDPHPWVEADRDALVGLGFQVADIDLKTCHGEELRKRLSGADIIFVAGGSTSYLLEQAQLSGFVVIARDLVRAGKIYVGSSAGSLLAGPDIEVDKVYDEGDFGKTLASYEGLGLVDFVVLPHADRLDYLPYLERAELEYGEGRKLVRLNEMQAIVVTDDGMKRIEA
ncbi:MAG: type 1 glutamine amidotransferase-like domain-containing protein [Candidatus Moranbacteria bacterium]|nr:type 1 glutamine amidotransferase-like domain-containing protein [Candidatus Moranbacteria bacterium]